MNSFKNFLKEWGLFLLILSLLALSRIFFWSNVRVEGHSMDPTLADGEILFVVKHLPIDRFDIVVAHEEDGNKDIVKRVIGMPGDTIRYENDKLYINDKETDEPYLADYIKRFKDDKLQSTYSGKGFEGKYLLLGDDRLVSSDSRHVGTFKAKDITGEAKFRFWPITRIGTF